VFCKTDSMKATLGHFDLQLDEGGKLAQLTVRDMPLLYEGDYLMAPGGGRGFAVRGWDECFPTIEPVAGFPMMGDLWSLKPDCVAFDSTVTQTWRTVRFIAARTFRAMSGDEMEMHFSARSVLSKPMEFLWAAHAIFSFDGLREVRLPDSRILRAFDLNRTSRKVFVKASSPVQLKRRSLTLTLTTDQPYWGIWLNRGGWPAENPAGFGCIGIEATNCPADSPRGARLMPGANFTDRFA